MGIFNSNIGSFFGKKDDQKSSDLDPQGQQLVDSAPFESMHSKPNPKEKVSPQKETVPENTFKNDLKSTSKKNSLEEKKQAFFQPETPRPINPILSPKNDSQSQPISQTSLPEKKDEKTSSKESPLKENQGAPLEEKKSGGKILAFIFTLLIILALAGGGYYYYFFIFKKAPVEDIENILPVTPEIENPVENENPEEKPKPDYLVIDPQNSNDPKIIIQEIGEKIISFKNEGKSGIFEYIVVDPQNNPLTFKDLALKLKIGLPEQIINLIGDEFRFFLFNDEGNPGIALMLNSKDDATLKEKMEQSEIDLINYLNPLLSTIMNPVPEIKSAIFQEIPYKETTNRYYNITSQNELSVDYIVFENKLFIGTTRNTVRAVYDLFEEESTKNEENKDTLTQPENNLIPENEAPTSEEVSASQENLAIPNIPQ